jgi:hypothetical protein
VPNAAARTVAKVADALTVQEVEKPLTENIIGAAPVGAAAASGGGGGGGSGGGGGGDSYTPAVVQPSAGAAATGPRGGGGLALTARGGGLGNGGLGGGGGVAGQLAGAPQVATTKTERNPVGATLVLVTGAVPNHAAVACTRHARAPTQHAAAVSTLPGTDAAAYAGSGPHSVGAVRPHVADTMRPMGKPPQSIQKDVYNAPAAHVSAPGAGSDVCGVASAAGAAAGKPAAARAIQGKYEATRV